jgi:hypothetical protein
VAIKGKTRNRFGWNKKQDLPEGWSKKVSEMLSWNKRGKDEALPTGWKGRIGTSFNERQTTRIHFDGRSED